MTGETRLVAVRRHLLKKNDVVARELRERFHREKTFVVSMVSSPGTGKTTLLRELLRQLHPILRVAALVGDLATQNDARRLAESGAPVRQIVTGTVCHLEAEMVHRTLEEWQPGPLDLLFIENVGNLVCPANYDLGEDLRLVLVSTTEGEDKPLKYPTIFNTADVAVITKMDLATATGFDRAALLRSIEGVRPGMQVIETSSRIDAGISELMELILARRRAMQRQ